MAKKKKSNTKAKRGARRKSEQTAARWRWQKPLVLLVGVPMLMAIFWWWRNGFDVPSEERSLPAERIAVSASHDRMLGVLREIHRRTDEENHWLGEGAARHARERLVSLSASAPPELRYQLLVDVAEHELRMGQEPVAIGRFEEALELLSRGVEGQDADERARLAFRLGVANLRYGESQNCAMRHSPESCILPIQGGGLHVDEQGSRQAIHYLKEVLDSTSRSSPLHLKALWLFNLAHMTLGEYPGGVPEEYRIPPEVFESEGSFPRFTNVAPALGLDSFNLSGGAVIDDFNGDGRLDLFTTTFDTRGEPHYFESQGDGVFIERTREAQLEGLYGGLNLVHADYDNDGDLDIFILRGGWLYIGGRHPNSLLRNDGNGRFEDVTFEAGMAEPAYPTQTASWADYDNDGDVDLFVGNEHGDGRGERGAGSPAFDAPSQLFRNNGDGTFTDVAREAGVQVLAYVKGVIWGDYDADRHPDLYVSVLGGPNHLFHNRGDGTFEDVTARAGTALPVNSFPVWFWDYDNDGHLDLYVPSYHGSTDGVALVAASYFGIEIPYDMPRLYRGDGQGGFEEVAREMGLDRLHLPMGSNFGDLDGDGYLDFYLGTGYPDYEAVMPNVLYRNDHGREFLDVTLAAGFGHLQKGHAVSFADVDHDGDQDLFAQMGGAFPGDRFSDALFLNPGFDHRWIALQLVGQGSNRAGIGARIRVDIVEAGKKRSIYRRVNSGGSFGCNPLRQTIGLGDASEIEQLEIYWPTTDTRHLLSDVPMDEVLIVHERGGFEVLELDG